MMIFPPKYQIFGVSVSATTYEETTNSVLDAARQRVPATVTHLAVHGLITASDDQSLRDKVNTFDIVAPDGQPVRESRPRKIGQAVK
jgi:N-acetylglucosaminyldiphosphoundecaprenol N-acetyl-beta-D-mannosaminyltransferase